MTKKKKIVKRRERKKTKRLHLPNGEDDRQSQLGAKAVVEGEDHQRVGCGRSRHAVGLPVPARTDTDGRQTCRRVLLASAQPPHVVF